MEKKKKSNISTIVLIAILLVGLSLLLYPTVSDYWNSFRQSKAIADYAETVAKLDEDEYNKILTAAYDYNRKLSKNGEAIGQAEKAEYESLLNISGQGIMGYIEIPEINCSLPIYHGTEDSVLQIAIGHIDWSSLPVGGEGSHCVLSGHRGLPSAKLFSNLDKLQNGDTFMIRVLDEVLTYEVDQILIVEPQEIDSLKTVAGKDYCTLVTCTPYGVNTHRLLVRGHRVENAEQAAQIRVTADANRIEPLIVAPFAAIPLLLVLLVILILPKKRKNRGEKYETE